MKQPSNEKEEQYLQKELRLKRKEENL